MKKQSKPEVTVDGYLEDLPDKENAVLTRIRKAIKTAAPKAVEKISYKIPVYRLKGDLIAFAAFKEHCSLITMSTNVIKKLKKELDTYKISGTTIQFNPDKPIPPALVRKIVSLRIRENSEAAEKRKLRK
jgi:uncharacterized protein YdhG (YjbR/CyaY superfamily)